MAICANFGVHRASRQREVVEDQAFTMLLRGIDRLLADMLLLKRADASNSEPTAPEFASWRNQEGPCEHLRKH